MPSKTQDFHFENIQSETLLCWCYGAFEQLGWTVKYFLDNKLVAFTPKSWNRYDDEIVAEVENGTLKVTSSLVHGEVGDMMGKNKKHLAAFSEVLEKTRISATDHQMEQWKAALQKLGSETHIELEKEMSNAAEIQKTMGTTGSRMYLTYGLIAINVLVFVMMVVSGVDIISPTADDI